MPVLETEGRVASRSEAENALVPVMYRQHALSAKRSHIATPMNATRTLRGAIFAYRAPAGLITICSMHMQDRDAVAYWAASLPSAGPCGVACGPGSRSGSQIPSGRVDRRPYADARK